MKGDLLFPEKRNHTEIYPSCWHLVDLLSFNCQQFLVESCRVWGKGRLKTWETSPGRLMNHPFFCVGHNWKPYEYYKGDVIFPKQLQMIWSALLRQCPDSTMQEYLIDAHNPDTAIVNWYPPGSSLAMHVDKSEDLELRQQGSPIVTIALGADATVKIGGFNKIENTKPKSIIMQSGDVLLMYGESCTRLHSVAKIHRSTEPANLLQSSGRISITMRRAKQ